MTNLPALRLPTSRQNGQALVQFQVEPDKMDWDDISEMPQFCANQAMVTNTGGQLHICFYEMLPPAATSAKVQKAVKRVRCKGVVRVVIGPGLAVGLIQLLQQQLQAAGGAQ